MNMKLLFTLCLFAPLSTDITFAQTLYNKAGDLAAQEAAKLATALTSTNVFDRQLKNLDLLSQQDSAAYYLQTQRKMRANIDQFSTCTWDDVSHDIDKIDKLNLQPNRISPEALIQTTTDITKQIAALNSQLAALKKNLAAQNLPSAESAMETIADVGQFSGFLAKVGTNQDAGIFLGHLGTSINIFATILTNYNTAISNINAQTKGLADLQSSLLQVTLNRLQVQADHVNSLTAIWERNKNDLAEVNSLISMFRGTMNRLQDKGIGGTNQITADIAKAISLALSTDPKGVRDPETITDVFLALHHATALYAHGDMPTHLAELRQAQEEQRFSIRLSAATAEVYETVLLTGTKRLSLYYQGGIKPETIAELLRTAATIAIPATIAAH